MARKPHSLRLMLMHATGEATEEFGSITTTPHPSRLHHMNGTINGTEQRPGVVTAISPDIVTVQIQQQSACSGCHARDLCVSSERREHQLQLKTYGQHFSIGEQVLVVARRSVGRLAVLLAFVLPLLLLVLTLSIAQTFLALSEAAAVLVAIGLLSLYYLVLYTQRHRLEGRLVLMVEPITPHHE